MWILNSENIFFGRAITCSNLLIYNMNILFWEPNYNIRQLDFVNIVYEMEVHIF